MHYHNIKKIAIILSLSFILTSCNQTLTINENQDKDIDTLQEETEDNTNNIKAVPTAYTKVSDIVSYDKDDKNTDWSKENPTYITLKKTKIKKNGSGVKINGSVATIKKAGTYVLSGNLKDGQIIVDTNKDSVVHLVLNKVNINCSDNAAIYCKQADKVVITLEEGTKNKITDGNVYQLEDGADEPSGAIFSKDDLTINGTGSLFVTANYNDGIVSKDDLKIVEGTIQITSKDDGMIGRDLLAIHSGTIDLITQGDGLKTTNDEDETKGNLVIEDGTINIKAQAKGINTNTNLLLADGIYVIESKDDSIHSNYNIVILNGNYKLTTQDDAIHADNILTIEDGEINILESYEGLESYDMELNGGTIYIKASDDGINTAGGNDNSAENGMFGKDKFDGNDGAELKITGGTIYVDASGDGIDSNGKITMTGGNVFVSGPTDNRNGTLDYNESFLVSGGILVAAGNNGMTQTISEDSNQLAISMTFSQMQETGTRISLKNSKEEEIASFTPNKQYANVIFSTSEIESGLNYSIYSGDTKIVEFSVTDKITYVNESGVTTGGNSKNRGQGGNSNRMPFREAPDGQTPPDMQDKNTKSAQDTPIL